MLRRHRLGVLALVVTGFYLAALAVAALVAVMAGDLGPLWRLTLFTEADESAPVTWPNVLRLVAAGLPWAWALWQSLRGPLAGPAPEQDRGTRRLRVALYVAAASMLLFPLMPVWPWWMTLLSALPMWAVVLLIQPVWRFGHYDHVLALGVLGFGGLGVADVLVALDERLPDWVPLVCGVAGLLWTVLVLRAQRRDDRWHTATVRYGIAGLVAPFVLVPVGRLVMGELYADVSVVAGALVMIWLARSAHDLAAPRTEPSSPVAEPVAT
ncbi:hypothetical protein E1286_21645 [Nonomuraea terrae]|uniref:DUF998 domain-containing protein n=1 Tax=Nonomuraea terrae TaxID=2530383 RepID=A0A4R4YNQ5_9ACTN|nr:hypothetical protein [Nonomuraea terrae]TDD46180.1 hypothetical protein E1286_21645 [Nonomuraea terrae]